MCSSRHIGVISFKYYLDWFQGDYFHKWDAAGFF